MTQIPANPPSAPQPPQPASPEGMVTLTIDGNQVVVPKGTNVLEAARQLKQRYGESPLAYVVEVEPWSRIPERRFALISYDP